MLGDGSLFYQALQRIQKSSCQIFRRDLECFKSHPTLLLRPLSSNRYASNARKGGERWKTTSSLKVKSYSKLGLWTGLGVAIGAGIGVATGSLAFGTSIGVAVGIFIGAMTSRQKE